MVKTQTLATPRWMTNEIEILTYMWEAGEDTEEIIERLDGRRTAYSIRKKAANLGITKGKKQGFLGEGSMPPESFWRWFAGFVDGEGSLCRVYSNKYQNYTLSFSVKNTHYPTMEYIYQNIGVGGVYEEKAKNLNSRDCKVWAVRHKEHLLAVLVMLEPHLITKREQALVMIEALKNNHTDVSVLYELNGRSRYIENQ